MSKKLVLPIPNKEDILKFTCDENHRSANDADNKIRENILANIKNIDDKFFSDPIYGEKWSKLISAFNNSMTQLQTQFDTFAIKYKAGRKNNYDFELAFFDENKNKIKVVKLEFKFNASKVEDVPQFVSPMKPSQYLSIPFEEYFYDTYLVSLLGEFNLQIPNRENYLKTIHTNGPICVKDAQLLYYQGCQRSSKYSGEEKAISFYAKANEYSKKGIMDFINLADLDITKLSQYILCSQKEKIYLLYKNGIFNIEKSGENENDFIIESCMKNPEKFRYEAVTKSNRKLNILLRWKNGNGIAYPAFQIS